jgi:hypothetical protein
MENRLFQAPKGEPVKPRVKEIKNTSGDALYQEALPGDKDVVKREAYALSTILMEYYHGQTMQEIAEDPDVVSRGLAKKMSQCLPAFLEDTIAGNPPRIWTVEDQALTVNQETVKQLPDQKFYELMTHSQGVSDAYKGIFQHFALDAIGGKGMPDRENAAYHRLADLLTTSKFRPRTEEFKKSTYSPEEFVLRGANSAAINTWSLFLSVVLAYNQEHNVPLTPEALGSVRDDIQKILTQVAALHIYDVTDFDDFRKTKAEEEKEPSFSWQTIIDLTGTREAPSISLNPEFVTEFNEFIEDMNRLRRPSFKTTNDGSEDLSQQELRHGCPAIIAEGEDGNIITDMVNFYEGLAERVLLPHQERFVRLCSQGQVM